MDWMNSQERKLYRVRLSRSYRDKALKAYPKQKLYETYSQLVEQFLVNLNENTHLLTETRNNARVSIWIDAGVSSRVVTRSVAFKVTPSRVVYTAIVLGLEPL